MILLIVCQHLCSSIKQWFIEVRKEVCKVRKEGTEVMQYIGEIHGTKDLKKQVIPLNFFRPKRLNNRPAIILLRIRNKDDNNLSRNFNHLKTHPMKFSL